MTRRLTFTRRALYIAVAVTASLCAALPSRADVPAGSHLDPIDAWSVKTLAIPATDVVYVPSRDSLLVTVSPDHAALGNDLIEVNPHTGKILNQVYVGSRPTHVAVSDDGALAYVTLGGASAITKVTLATFTASQVIDLPKLDEPMVAEDVAVAPGQPNVIAVSLAGTIGSPRHRGVWAMANGVALPNYVEYGDGNELVFASPSTLLGFDTEGGSSFVRLTLSANGLSKTAGFEAGVPGVVLGDGLLAEQNGKLYELGTKQILRTFNTFGFVAPSVGDDRIAFLRWSNTGGATLFQFVLSTGEPTGERYFPELSQPSGLVATATGYAGTSKAGLTLFGSDVDGSAVVIPTGAGSKVDPRLVESRLPFAGRDLAWDAGRNLLYVLVGSPSDKNPNELVALDPKTRAVVKHVAIDGNPVAMDITDDNAAIFVATKSSVVRVNLATFAADNPIALGTIGSTAATAWDIDVQPGATSTFAVTLSSSGNLVVAVFKDGVRLPDLGSNRSASTQFIRFTSATRLVGTELSYGAPLAEYAVGPTGATVTRVTNYIAGGGEIAVDARGFVWTGEGRVIDPSGPTMVARAPDRGPILIDAGNNRVYQGAFKEFIEVEKSSGRVVSRKPMEAGVTGTLTKFGVGFVGGTYGNLVALMPAQCAGSDATIMSNAATVNGTSGNDVIIGTGYHQTINGKSGNDIICGSYGDGVINGGDGNDYLVGAGSNDTIDGGAGIDYLFGGFGNDTLIGGAGNDRLDGGWGQDDLDGGDGTDIYTLGSERIEHIVTLNNVADDGAQYEGQPVEGDNIRSNIEIVVGSPGDDVMLGSDSFEWFLGAGGNDELHGAGGNDQLDGGAGNDTLFGDAGNDNLYGGLDTDQCAGGEGTNSLFGCEAP